MSVIETKEGIILSIFVKPNSSKFKIEFYDGEIVVYATEEPEKGKVNKEIIKELSRLFKVKVELVSGFTSKQKTFLLRDISKSQIETQLTTLSNC